MTPVPAVTPSVSRSTFFEAAEVSVMLGMIGMLFAIVTAVGLYAGFVYGRMQ